MSAVYFYWRYYVDDLMRDLCFGKGGYRWGIILSTSVLLVIEPWEMHRVSLSGLILAPNCARN